MQNSREIFIKILNHEKADRYPAAPHWWGVYKYQALGLDVKKAAWQEGAKIADIYMKFYEKFLPDWFHLHIGTPRYFKNSQIIQKNNKYFLVIDPEYRDLKSLDKYFSASCNDDEEIIDFPDFLLWSRNSKPKVDLSSKYGIDEFIRKYVHMDSDDIEKLGYTDHLKAVAEKYGNQVFIVCHIPSAICEIFDPMTGYTGFEQGLLAFHDWPEGMRYLLERCYEEQLEWAKAYAKAGAHGFAISEAYVSPDLANPGIYRKFIKDIHRNYFSEVKRMGLFPLCYFTGDINPIIEDIAGINLQALMIEESKKGFVLDVAKIRQKIGDRICVFGNIDSIYLLHDSPAGRVKDEVLAQLKGAENNFITCNGSPITPGTPEENVVALIEAGKSIF
jgi:hypothetical protein